MEIKNLFCDTSLDNKLAIILSTYNFQDATH